MQVDAIIVGSGQAGVPLATRLAQTGRRVLLVERGALGGTCVNYGCTPSKTMIASARAAHVARTADRLGVHTGEVRVDLARVVARKDEIVQRWREGIVRRLEAAGSGLVFLEGHARFVSPREIEVAGERHRADTIVLNVGARPLVPRGLGLESVPWLDNHRLMDLREAPAHLAVVGAGYVGCELGQMFRRFGSRVTIVGRGPHLLDREDHDVSSALEQVFREEGIALRLGCSTRRIERSERADARPDEAIVVRLDGHEDLRASHVLLAVGRRPNTDDLGGDAAGIKLDGNGYVIVDEAYRTTAEGVYAVGDATAQPQFTHTSWDDHRILFDVLTGRGARGRSSRIIPSTVFTDPQVARVGLSETEARAQGASFEVATMPFGGIARAFEVGETAGMLKVLVDPSTDRVLGAAIVGAEAGELVHVFVALMAAGAPARAIVDAEFVHPTFAEGLQTLVMRLKRHAL
jgi:pyruvate/2-oxoglutarate dehydrogenase complex dihydrolipoamide dehydrogenase (E3) component